MCGITARVGEGNSVETLLTSLKNLEYRGYDSAGLALENGTTVAVTKTEGDVSDLQARLNGSDVSSGTAIGHTRWSTHGPPSDRNAHPHTDCTGEVAVVHNGIIENYDQLRDELRARGHVFASETDTEVVPHLVEEALDRGLPTEQAFRDAIGRLEGSYALAMIAAGEETIYAARDGSPLVVGLDEDATHLASDVPAFIEQTDRVVYLKDGDTAVLTQEGCRVTDAAGRPVDRPAETVEWSPEAAEKGGHDHYMFKEIQEQPTALRQAIEGRIDGSDVVLEDFPPGAFADVTEVHLVACGTSYHAGLYGEQFLADWGIPAQTFFASEYGIAPPPVDEGTLVLGVTQSGETADTLEALRVAREGGARTLAVTNIVGSSAARQCDDALFIRAGPEIGVAATKTFSSQVATLLLLGERIVRDRTGHPTDGHAERLSALQSLPDHVDSVLESTRAEGVARRYLDADSHFFIGRGSAYPVAIESALKFKEITYKHAEGFPAGELKHGPLALVTPDTPVFAVCTGRDESALASNASEVQARDGPVVAVAPRSATSVADVADALLAVPATHPDLVPVLANVQLQLLAYHTAAALDRPIDKPRNLAKSVTVE
jgi:glucosamine--fructose-6-phosphate aminotransferase (isomerizing)